MADQSQKAVLAAGAVLGAMVLVHARKTKASQTGSVFKQVWAVGVLTLALAVTADFAPQVAVPMAVAVVVGYTLKNPGLLGPLFVGKTTKATAKKGG